MMSLVRANYYGVSCRCDERRLDHGAHGQRRLAGRVDLERESNPFKRPVEEQVATKKVKGKTTRKRRYNDVLKK